MAADRKIIHVDMDAFFASVEQRERPELRGKPVVVGGSPESRSVVCAASYEARRFGVHSAMPCSQAKRLCPQAIFVNPNFSLYRSASNQIMEIFHQFTDLVEPLSLDEAFLDVTANRLRLGSATETAQAIRARIFAETALTASAGVAPNKFLAKVASDMNKPNGLTIIKPSMVERVLESLPVRKVPGIGRVTEEKLAALGILTTGDLLRFSEAELAELFGKVGGWYYRLARGIDQRPVVTERTRRSVSCEDTFSTDTLDLVWMGETLQTLAVRLATRLENAGAAGRTVSLKVTYGDFEKATRSKTLSRSIADPASLFDVANSLLHATEAGERPIRLLGIGVSNLDGEKTEPEAMVIGPRQLELPFGRGEAG